MGVSKNLPLKPCEWCGDPIPKEKNRNWVEYAKKRTCSRKCFAAIRSGQRAIACSTCGKEFTRSISLIRATVYCSQECRRRRKTIVCAKCGVERVVRQCERNGARPYCSRRCASLSKRKNAPQNHGRRSPEDIAWRNAVMMRDGWRCLHCGTNKRLEAHHPSLVSRFPELRHVVENGMTLCHDCHYYGVHNGMPNFIHGRYATQRRDTQPQIAPA